MRGRRIFRSDESSFPFLTGILFLGALALWSCSGSKEVEPGAARTAPLPESLRQYEKSFNPADYDADIQLVKQEEKTQRSALEAASVVTTALPETIPGFRVQILLTQEIDQAVQVKDSVDALLPDEWAYIVYDSPYYKVRVGNCEDRALANPLLKKLGSLGFKDAWIVPDNVLKNLPPKPPELNIEPEKQIEHHRQ